MHTAEGQGYIDDAIEGIEGDGVYVSPEVPDSAALHDSLDQQVGDASIGIAVFSDNASLEASGSDIVDQLAAAHPDCETVIVAVGDDLWAGSRTLPEGEAIRIANEAEQSAGSVEEALSETVERVIAASDDPAAGGSPGIDGGLVGAGVIAVITLGALAAAAGVTVGIVRGRRGTRRGGNRQLPDKVRPLVGRLRELSAQYAVVGAAGDQVAAEVGRDSARIADNTTELFERLGRKGDEGQRATAAVEYGETLRKLTAALDRDYLLDILQHPDLWDDPQDRIREVREAVHAFSAELVENIKQVNARRGLHFQVSLDGLVGRRKELQEWDRAFDRAQDDGTGPVPRAD